jgi:hypothetical protein
VNSGVDPRQGGPTTAMLALIHAQIDAGLKISVASTFGRDFESGAAERMRQVGADCSPDRPLHARDGVASQHQARCCAS